MLQFLSRDLGRTPTVFLVGAGPGDPDLLTVRALRLLQTARVLVYDRLVGAEILDLVPPQAVRIYVGKASRHHTMTQGAINQLLLELADRHGEVVRLKGGDPFVFGRGSEEAEFLVRRGVRCEVVPGVTAAAGCAAEAGIPLTHRGLATGVRFVTGHARDDEELELDWDRLADPDTTVVVYMGLGTVGRVSERLIASGLPPDTPAAAIASGTTPRRQLCITTLAALAADVAQAELRAPVLLVIGRVVTMARVLGKPDAAERTKAEAAGAFEPPMDVVRYA